MDAAGAAAAARGEEYFRAGTFKDYYSSTGGGWARAGCAWIRGALIMNVGAGGRMIR